jgi:hypothetical protein
MRMYALSYVLPLKAKAGVSTEFVDYINRLSDWVEVIVVDGSPADIYRDLHERRSPRVTHIPPDDDLMTLRNGKVRGVLTGLRAASHDRVVLADDDVRYATSTLFEIYNSLNDGDVVRPQNYFHPLPWHARVDTARILINRVTGGDWPGTLGLRRSALGPHGAYDGDVLFENLELVRTVTAAGGSELQRPDLFVRRRPPTTRHFWSQRIRQAYDEFARPARLAAALAVVPGCGALIAAGQWWGALIVFGALPIGVAELGRRHTRGSLVFPFSAALCAPVWVMERGVCAWLAVGARLVLGGIPYAGGVLRVAANSEQTLVRRHSASRPAASAGLLER